ncbi:MAG: prepilin-type N-terminal cleavage/methylation domain-containing protein [bacterium]|nr:prepilin-type N-terminal cleavage/methylation domain-containing protein [bacterium]
MTKGFTFIELLIVISITAILATVGAMNLIGYRQERDLNFAVQEIITVLRNSQDRSIAQEEGSRWGIYFNNPTGDSNDFYELFKGTSYAGGIVASKIALRSNIQFDTPTSNSSSTVIFAPITGLPSASITIKISLIGKPTSSSTIIINTNGEISF